MEQQDIDEIIKEWLEEWKNPPEYMSEDHQEKGKDKETYKGKEKMVE